MQLTFQQDVQAEGQAPGGTFLSKHSGYLFQVPENNGKWHELDTTILDKVSKYLVHVLRFYCILKWAVNKYKQNRQGTCNIGKPTYDK